MAEHINNESGNSLGWKDESEFPPLPQRERPKALAIRPTSKSAKVMATQSNGNGGKVKVDISSPSLFGSSTFDKSDSSLSPMRQAIGTKRPKEDVTKVENSTADMCSPLVEKSTDNYVSSAAESPSKRSKRMCYREPPVLKSLDSDSFSFLSAQTKVLADSPLSEIGHSTPTISPTSSLPMYENNNLGSLTDFIHQYSGTTLNALSDFESPTVDMPNDVIALTLQSSSSNEGNSCQTASNITEAPPLQETPVSSCHQPKSHSLSFQPSSSENKKLQGNLTNKVTHITDQAISPPKVSPTSNSPFPPVKAGDDVTASQPPEDNCNIGNPSSTVDQAFLEENDDIKSRACKKNPRHEFFYLPSELKVKDLPLEIQHEDSLTFFNCLSQLVVRITVSTTSEGRGPNDMYSNYIGTSRRRNGSGFIASVDDHLKKKGCKREDCCGSDNPDATSSFEDSGIVTSPPPLDRNLSNISTASSGSSSSGFGDGSNKHSYYGGIYINTNKHVIFDKSEADTAFVTFFYNTQDKEGVFYGHVDSITGISARQDRVTLLVMFHDRKLYSLVNLHLKNARSSYLQMLRSTHVSQQVHGHGKEHSWAVVISHPHGLAKCITCGRVKCEKIEATRVVKYYDAATCPGSSGGLVITPSLLQLQWPGAVHSCTDATSGFNVTFDSRVPDLDVKQISRIHKPLLGRKDSASDNIYSL